MAETYVPIAGGRPKVEANRCFLLMMLLSLLVPLAAARVSNGVTSLVWEQPWANKDHFDVGWNDEPLLLAVQAVGNGTVQVGIWSAKSGQLVVERIYPGLKAPERHGRVGYGWVSEKISLPFGSYILELKAMNFTGETRAVVYSTFQQLAYEGRGMPFLAQRIGPHFNLTRSEDILLVLGGPSRTNFVTVNVSSTAGEQWQWRVQPGSRDYETWPSTILKLNYGQYILNLTTQPYNPELHVTAWRGNNLELARVGAPSSIEYYAYASGGPPDYAWFPTYVPRNFQVEKGEVGSLQLQVDATGKGNFSVSILDLSQKFVFSHNHSLNGEIMHHYNLNLTPGSYSLSIFYRNFTGAVDVKIVRVSEITNVRTQSVRDGRFENQMWFWGLGIIFIMVLAAKYSQKEELNRWIWYVGVPLAVAIMSGLIVWWLTN